MKPPVASDIFTGVFQRLPHPILVSGKDGKFVAANRAACDLFDRSQKKIIGLKWSNLVSSEHQVTAGAEQMSLLEQESEAESGEFVLPGGEKTPRRFEFLTQANVYPGYQMRLIKEKPSADLVQKKEANARATAAQKVAEANAAFLAVMSHEIRTPLNALIGFNDLLMDSELAEKERKECHQAIARNGELLMHLIDDILDYSKIEAGHISLSKVPVVISELLEEVILPLKKRAEKKELRITIQRGPGCPSVIHTDPRRLKQILNNLIDNAVKFTAQGEVSVTVSCAESLNKVRIEVRDTGPGIAGAVRDRLFEAFSQVDASMTRRYGGTGLGLILSKKLAQNLGGDVWLENSVVGQGSRFVVQIDGSYIKLPGISAPKDAAAKDVAGKFLGELAGKRILLVEDSSDNRLLVDQYLKRRGATVLMAENGLRGVEIASHEACDLVLMDLQMPVLDGYMATQQLRAKGFSKPIVALTAHAMDQDRQRCLAGGFTEYLTKPIRAKTLTDVVRKLTSAVPASGEGQGV
ncbi:MAG: hypothetical protein COT73_11635 [Bdellovibrio sp. CG10_big_fil_rev_8_21_14_0_10_47_8]|nr:MAG: hypothetical protein COT73_11635 [Bdellovibrio sp. CG10_big_fil_rev_8_21_14_0_10_47_8]